MSDSHIITADNRLTCTACGYSVGFVDLGQAAKFREAHEVCGQRKYAKYSSERTVRTVYGLFVPEEAHP